MSRKILALLCAASISLSLFAACGSDDSSSDLSGISKDEISSVSDNKEESSELQATDSKKITVDYSLAFSIEVLSDGVKKVTDGDGRELYLVPKELKTVPNEYADKTVVRTPVDNVCFTSSTQISMLSAADEKIWDSVGGVIVNTDYSLLQQVQSRLDCGDIVNIGADVTAPDYEAIVSLEPDIVFVTGGSYPMNDVMTKLDELGINYCCDNEYEETDFLARMEWIKFVLTFFEEDDAAQAKMEEATASLEKITNEIKELEASDVAQFSVWSGEAYVTSNSSWVGSMMSSVGGENVFGKVSEYSLSLEELLEKASNADVLIYADTPTYTPDLAAIEDAFPQITSCKAYESGRIYQYTDMFWLGIGDTDNVAADLAAICYPEAFPDRELTYYKKIS